VVQRVHGREIKKRARAIDAAAQTRATGELFHGAPD
jgi:hypothetical protein